MAIKKEIPPKLSLWTKLLIEEHWGGNVLSAPVADLDLVSYGEEAEALLEQEIFLTEYLEQVEPRILARFPIPEGITLKNINLLLPRKDLPQKLSIQTPLSIPYIEIPAGEERWIIVLPLQYTIYLERGEDAEAVIRSEVERLLGAEERSPEDYLKLFPAKALRLEDISLTLSRTERLPEGRAASLRKTLVESHKRKLAAEILESVSLPWHTTAQAHPNPPIMGREVESRLLSALLEGTERSSVLLLGAEGSGKSAMLRAWFDREKSKKRNRLVYQTSGAQLIAGMSGLGQWQERIRRVFNAAEQLDAILYFDNLNDLFAERVEGSIDLAGAIKPYLERGRVRLVGELTPEMLDLAERKQAGFLTCLNRVKIDPLPASKMMQILRERIAHDQRIAPEMSHLDERAIQPLIDLTERYFPHRVFPGKAIQLYEELCLVHKERNHEREKQGTLTSQDLYEHFSLNTGIPAFLLREDQALHVQDVIDFLQQYIIGQRNAVCRVAETVCVVKAGLQPTGKPLATFLFVGPTGVGKTELAKALATFLFRSPERLIRFDMSEYMDADAAGRLIHGTDRADGLLTRKVREQPFSVLLLDEIEKASQNVFDLLLQVCGEGRLTDARGKVAYFHNTILILTSNLGAAHHRSRAGFGDNNEEDEVYYTRQVRNTFRPEFVNRLDRIIAFRPLLLSEVQKIARLTLNKICARQGFLETKVCISINQEALAILAYGGYSERYGARALRRHMEDHLVVPIARLLAPLDDSKQGATLRIFTSSEPEEDVEDRLANLEDLGLRFEVLRPQKSLVNEATERLYQIIYSRQACYSLLQFPRIEQVKEQIDHLIAQINCVSRDPNDIRVTQDISELQTEFHRLNTDYQQLLSAIQHAEFIEELALSTFFANQPITGMKEDAESAKRLAYQAAVRLLLSLEPRRDAVTLRIFELSENGSLALWLTEMIPIFRAHAWEISCHILDDPLRNTGLWPQATRRWGPPRTLDELLYVLQLQDGNDPPCAILLCCRGPLAGVQMAMEAGVHQWVSQGGMTSSLVVTLVAMRATLTEQEWSHSEVSPPTAALIEEGKRTKPLRLFNANTKELTALLVDYSRHFSCTSSTFHEFFDEIIQIRLSRYEYNTNLDRDALFTAPLDNISST